MYIARRPTRNRVRDAGSVTERHARLARWLSQFGLEALRGRDPSSLRPAEALQLIRLAVEIERQLQADLERVDLSQLTIEELEALARGR